MVAVVCETGTVYRVRQDRIDLRKHIAKKAQNIVLACIAKLGPRLEASFGKHMARDVPSGATES